MFATASPGKHGVLRAMGLDEEHIASSRDAGFEEAFLAATGGAGVDLVLNALAGELTDASLRLLPRGGVFLEMGKTDVRDPGEVAAGHPGVAYRAFDLVEAGPERLGEILARGDRAAGGRRRWRPAPVRCWDVRRAPEAFRFMSQARHTGKIVLTIPPDPAAPREPGTVLVTGGTGTLGALVARHLAATGQARLAAAGLPVGPGRARRGRARRRPGRGRRRGAGRRLRRGRPGRAGGSCWPRCRPAGRCPGWCTRPGCVDDGVTGSLTPARVDAVMRPKADAAWHLHELTAGADLESFVLFSSAAASLRQPGAGQLRGGATRSSTRWPAARRAAGLPGQSLGWGLWAGDSAMTGHLSGADLDRIARGGMTRAERGGRASGCWTWPRAGTRRTWSRRGLTWPGCGRGPGAARTCPPLLARTGGPGRAAASRLRA